MKKLFLVVAFFACAIMAVAQTQTERALILDLVSKFEQTLKQKDYSKIESHLDANYEYNGNKGELARNILKQVLPQYPFKVSKLDVLSVEKKDEGFVVKVTVKKENGDQDEPLEIRVSAQIKLLQADIVKISMMHHGGGSGNAPIPKPEMNLSETPDYFSLAFELVNNWILLKAKVNGKEGWFILDSGAPSIMLNQVYFPDLTAGTQMAAKGVNSALMTSKVNIDAFSCGSLQLKKVDVLKADIKHLERRLQGRALWGLIGADVLAHFTTVYDYANRKLDFYRLDQQGNLRSANNFHPVKTIGFENVHHLPVIRLQIGDQTLKMALDVGAGENLLNTPSYERVKPFTKVSHMDTLRGAGTGYSLVQVINANQSALQENIRLNAMNFLVSDNAALTKEQADGMLGYSFFSQRKMALNMRKKQLYLFDK